MLCRALIGNSFSSYVTRGNLSKMRFIGGGIEKRLRFCGALADDDRTSLDGFDSLSEGIRSSLDIAVHYCWRQRNAHGNVRGGSPLGSQFVKYSPMILSTPNMTGLLTNTRRRSSCDEGTYATPSSFDDYPRTANGRNKPLCRGQRSIRANSLSLGFAGRRSQPQGRKRRGEGEGWTISAKQPQTHVPDSILSHSFML